MKKYFIWMMNAILVCGAGVFTSCTVDNTDNPAIEPDLGVAEKIIGKWMSAEINGKPFPTDNKGVYTFLTTTTARMSSSVNSRPELGDLWNDNSELDVNISGNVVTLTHQLDEHKAMTIEMNVTSINDKEMHADVHASLMVDGTVARTMNDHIRYERIEKNYRAAIIGMWEGCSTGAEGSEFDDGENHRWEYLADGTFRYYHKMDGLWQLSNDVLNEYFVDGKLLCTRWKNAGEGKKENREWWEIESIENDVMKWKALRMREDGSTYTATFEMKKVAMPTKEEIEQNIIGKWVATEINGKAALTNQMFVYDFMASEKGAVSFSANANHVAPAPWFDKKELDYFIDNNYLTLSIKVDEQTTLLQQFAIASIGANKMECVLQQISYSDAAGLSDMNVTFCTFQKLDKDYSADIVGTWQGVSSTVAAHGDVANQRWEYKADGTYIFSMKNTAGEWVVTEDVYSNYFVAGNLLCICYKNVGEGKEEQREWWEIISLENGVMKMTAKCKKTDGTIYTETFEMKKVE